jgi:Tol biopolymer transport system component
MMHRIALAALAALAAGVAGLVLGAGPGRAQREAAPLDGLIVFSCDGCPRAQTTSHLFTIRPDGSRLRVLPSSADAYEPRWSPHGPTVAFSRGFAQIWLSGDDGAPPRRLTRPIGGAQDTAPAWSPDGRRLVFVRLAPRSPGRSGGPRTALWTIGATGARPRRLLSADRNVGTPDWSPDGSRIAFFDVTERLWVAHADGTAHRRLGPATLHGRDPRWSPDGTRIALADVAAGVIRILDMRTGRVRTLLSFGSFQSYAWSPDGRWLATMVTTPTSCDDPSGCETLELWIVSAAGAARRRIWSVPYGEVYGIDWRV